MPNFFNKYPYTDFHEMNLDWILSEMKGLVEKMENFININSIKYAVPIYWSIASSYEANTIVMDPVHYIAYLSLKAVPAGTSLDNEDYWMQILDFSKIIDGLNIATPEMFGAVGDGVADDTDAINDAAVYARDNNKILLMNKNYNTSADCIMEGPKTILAFGTVKNLWLRNSSNGFYLIMNAEMLKITSIKNSTFIPGNIIDMQFVADEALNTMPNPGVAYNTIIGGFAHNVLMKSEHNSGTEWINENMFYSVRMINVSIIGGYSHNNNQFDNVTIEGGTVTLTNAKSNAFKLRAESGFTLVTNDQAFNNTFDRTYAAWSPMIFMNLPQTSIRGNIDNNVFMKNYERYTICDVNNRTAWNNSNDYTNNTLHIVAWRSYSTKRIKITNDVILRFRSDIACFRPVFTLYKNGAAVLNQSDNVVGSGLTFNTSTGDYSLATNVSDYSCGIVPGTDFDEIEVRAYASVTTDIKNFRCDAYTLGKISIGGEMVNLMVSNAAPTTAAIQGMTVNDSTGASYGWYFNGTSWVQIS